jgi:cation diffusion facilitator CzcD-associated flavoprotein CzcO
MSSKADKRVAIIGAGVAGCATAAALKDYNIDFVVYDANDRAGGLWADNYPGAKGKDLPWCFVLAIASWMPAAAN